MSQKQVFSKTQLQNFVTSFVKKMLQPHLRIKKYSEYSKYPVLCYITELEYFYKHLCIAAQLPKCRKAVSYDKIFLATCFIADFVQKKVSYDHFFVQNDLLVTVFQQCVLVGNCSVATYFTLQKYFYARTQATILAQYASRQFRLIALSSLAAVVKNLLLFQPLPQNCFI